MIRVRFATLAGPFRLLGETKHFDTPAAALAAVKEYAEAAGYSNIKPVEDADSVRYTARTPGGRGGRNVAFADWDWEP